MQKHRRLLISAAEVTVFIAQIQQETASTRVHHAVWKLVLQPFFPWRQGKASSPHGLHLEVLRSGELEH